MPTSVEHRLLKWQDKGLVNRSPDIGLCFHGLGQKQWFLFWPSSSWGNRNLFTKRGVIYEKITKFLAGLST